MSSRLALAGSAEDLFCKTVSVIKYLLPALSVRINESARSGSVSVSSQTQLRSRLVDDPNWLVFVLVFGKKQRMTTQCHTPTFHWKFNRLPLSFRCASSSAVGNGDFQKNQNHQKKPTTLACAMDGVGLSSVQTAGGWRGSGRSWCRQWSGGCGGRF